MELKNFPREKYFEGDSESPDLCEPHSKRQIVDQYQKL